MRWLLVSPALAHAIHPAEHHVPGSPRQPAPVGTAAAWCHPGAANANSSSTSRIPRPCRFDDACKHFKPVLHNFFLERYRAPATWFERRLAFTRSVAVSSIAGAVPPQDSSHISSFRIFLQSLSLLMCCHGAIVHVSNRVKSKLVSTSRIESCLRSQVTSSGWGTGTATTS